MLSWRALRFRLTLLFFLLSHRNIINQKGKWPRFIRYFSRNFTKIVRRVAISKQQRILAVDSNRSVGAQFAAKFEI
jgi:hypothetical protein